MLCAVYSSPQDRSKHSILWLRLKPKIFETKEQTEWQLKKVARSQRKKVARRAARRAARRQPRRDSSSLDGRTATLNWRTQTSTGQQGLSKGTTSTSSESRRSFCISSLRSSHERLRLPFAVTASDNDSRRTC